MKTLAITGASGFIGVHLVRALLAAGGNRIKILTRSLNIDSTRDAFPPEVEIVVGDITNLASLDGFLEPGCTLINLAYLVDEDDSINVAAINNLLVACKSARIARFIHCSTADVAGRTPDQRVMESSPCRPFTAYAMTKLKLEAVILASGHDCFDVAILRPTAVFGPGGQNLKKLAQDLVHGVRLFNKLKSLVFGFRSMNLIHVDNVVAALIFLIDDISAFDGEVFIVSDDDASANNFFSVRLALINGFGIRDISWPHIFFPTWLLSLMLRLLMKNNVNPLCRYDSGKLRFLGFRGPMSFDESLSSYIAWYRSACLKSPGKVDS
ncbi:MAG: NAD-dependent epimerase/dehydratase family protein [Rhodoferax sp.]|uniref:NAD-dependent epimerase/dehydratase family protein n=1 Tax=Rhodoferax sp. TaxID=50421 RepID=UPI0017BDB008|nr:NAD-dependent epimerase/dehydratase family protein [Rhodoferax sp.]NMM13771.1 NAD-dependent epimerase/dehydratase family protein [Rhodoferax sp.]